MQHYSPCYGFPTGNNFYAPVAPLAPSPQIVGEGDVASLTLPDGSLQLYFVPAAVNYQPYPVAWFIRTIPNLFPAQPPALNQQIDTISSKHSLPQLWTREKPGRQLQFHSDKTTSSTDIHYFSKPTHPSYWDSKQDETQVEQPTKLYGMSCCQACPCKNCQKAGSGMSIDSVVDENRDRKWNKKRYNLDKSMETASKSVKYKKQPTSEKSIQSVRDQPSQASPPRSRARSDDCLCP